MKECAVLNCFCHVQLFATLWASWQGSPVHGILQARILEWVTMPFYRGSAQPRDQTHVSYISGIGRWVLYHCATWKAPILLYINCTPLQYSCLENPMDGGAWRLQSMGSIKVGHD